jgi:hypothetical protein
LVYQHMAFFYGGRHFHLNLFAKIFNPVKS